MKRDRGMWFDIGWIILLTLAALFVLWFSGRDARACEPDLVNYTPTPTFKWDRVTDSDLAGFWLWYRLPGGTFQRACQLPIQRWPEVDEQGHPTGRILEHHPGVDLDVPIQRCLEGYELQMLEWSVTSYDAVGNESVSFATCAETDPTQCTVCMPRIWRPGVPYE